MTDTKRVIHANVSDETFEAWQEFSIEHGVSVTGIIEALGSVGPIVGQRIEASTLVKAARQVDGERRRRGGARK